MKILQVVHDFIPEVRAGTELLTYYLSKGLQKRNHEILIFYPTWGIDSVVRKKIDGLNCISFPNTSTPRGVFSDFNQNVNEMFRKVVSEFKPEVVHIQNLIYLSLDIVNIAKEYNAVVCFTLQDFWLVCPRTILLAYDEKKCSYINIIKCVECCKRIVPLELIDRFRVSEKPRLPNIFNKWRRRIISNIKAFDYLKNTRNYFIHNEIFKKVDLFIAPSQFLRQRFIREGIPEDKIIFLDCGIEHNNLENINRIQTTTLRFGFIGSILQHKGIEVLIKAFNSIENAELKIFGKLDNNNLKFKSLISNPRIKFVGEVEEDEKQRAYNQIDVLIVPSIWYENAPVVIHEAYYSGIPVIASRLGGMAEYVRDNETGLLFETGNSDDLAVQINRMIENPSLVERFRNNLPKYLSLEKHAEVVEKLYLDILQSKLPQINIDLKEYGYRLEDKFEEKETRFRFMVATTLSSFVDAIKGTRKSNNYLPNDFIFHTYQPVSRKRIIENKAPIIFGDTIKLLNYHYRIMVNNTVEIEFLWELISKFSKFNKVFVHFCVDSKMLFAFDYFVLNTKFPLDKWKNNQIFRENIQIQLPQNIANTKNLEIKIGFYNIFNLKRFNVNAPNNFTIDDSNTRVSLGKLHSIVSEKESNFQTVEVSIVIPTKNAGHNLAKTLDIIFKQKTNRNYEVLIIDSASTDETLTICADYDVRLLQITEKEFNHGLTRNYGVYNSRGEYVILMVQDAIPSDEYWLENLIKHFDDPKVAGVYCRQIPNEDTDALTKRQLNNWITARNESVKSFISDWNAYIKLPPMDKYVFTNFDNVCSCVRKKIWEDYPFPKTEFAEDLYYSQKVLEAGYKIVFEPTASVYHSHNRSMFYEYSRTYICHQKLYDLFELQTVPTIKHVLKFTIQNILKDYPYVFKNEKNIIKLLSHVFKIPFLSFLTVYAQYKGALEQKMKKRKK